MCPPEKPPMHPSDPDEVDVDLDEPEYLGDYASIEAYLRATLEPEISPGVAWLLDCLDMPRVLARFERDGSRLHLDRGRVFRVH